MGSRKRPRRGNAEGSSIGAPSSLLRPSQATTTSQVTSLSAAPEPSTSATATSRTGSDKEMPPPPLPKLDSSNKKDGSSVSEQQGNKVIQKTRSWYGSLSRKSTASTSLQKEAIASSPLKAGSTPDFHRYELKRNGETASLSGASQASVHASSKPLENITNPSAAKGQPASDETDTSHIKSANVVDDNNDNGDAAAAGSKDDGRAGADTPMPDAPPPADTPQRPSTSSGWLGAFFTRTSLPESKSAEAGHPTQETREPPKETEPEAARESAATVTAEQSTPEAAGQGPASYWSYIFPIKAAPQHSSGEEAKKAESTPAATGDTPMEDVPPTEPEPAPKPSAGSTWAFWSISRPKSSGKQPEAPETGEIAIIGEGSESHPKRANSMDMSREASAKAGPSEDESSKARSGKDKPGKRSKKARPQSMDLDEVPSRPQTPQSDAASIKVDSPSKSKAKTPTTAAKPAPPNLLLPSFKGTYRMKENPSILKQITALLLRTQQPSAKHVFLAKDPPRVKKAIAIGVHGLFPATYLRAMIGQPTGTSIKFADNCAEAIRRWADVHGSADCVIEKVALEGEGKIEARVANLWKLLQNWMDHIREADLVVVACHSQGVPVSIMLLEKLIDSGVIRNAKIGVCAMAGVSLGPFPDYRNSMGMLMGTAAELWEFSNSESEVSRRYESALKRILTYGVRITFVGSIDDQLVPIESAIYSPASHPYIYRAIFIDGRIHAPDFIAHLVGFACKLRNLGISDHGLVRELSVPLAGSLYGGEGHSRLYEDSQVYDLAITHALQTTDVGTVSCEIKKYDGLTNPNPYHLPWIMRGLLEEDLVKTELSTETEELLRQFDDWKPVTKALKDVKWRLEAVRSKL